MENNLYTCSLVQEPNSSYLVNLQLISKPQLDSPTIGLMMVLSTLQYQAPYLSPNYSNAAYQASKAAQIESGLSDVQARVMKLVTNNAKDTIKSIGITDTEMVILLGTTSTIRNKNLDLKGPELGSIKTHLNINTNSGSVGFKYDW